MEYSDEALEKQALEQDKRIDAKAAELLNHDPELVALYHRSKQWKLGASALMGQLIVLIQSDQIALQLQNWISNYKNVSDRMQDLLPEDLIRQGVASDCAEALEVAADNLKLLATEIRRQISELPPITVSDPDQWKKVEEAGLKATIQSFRQS